MNTEVVLKNSRQINIKNTLESLSVLHESFSLNDFFVQLRKDNEYISYKHQTYDRIMVSLIKYIRFISGEQESFRWIIDLYQAYYNEPYTFFVLLEKALNSKITIIDGELDKISGLCIEILD